MSLSGGDACSAKTSSFLKKLLTKYVLKWDNRKGYKGVLSLYDRFYSLVMSMRIITGLARGRRLAAPAGNDVRPTPERVKEGIFSSLQFDLEGRRVLDLFAGSGQLGLEAISRGAQNAVLVDASDASIKIIRQNIDAVGFAGQARAVRADYASFLASNRETFDLVFLDPPYAAGLLIPALRAVLPAVSPYGCIVCEHPAQQKLPEQIGSFSVSRFYRYGKVCMTVYRKEEAQ